MRREGMLFILVLFAIAGIAASIWSDGLLEISLEQTFGNVIGAKVEIDNLKYYLRGPAISFDRLQIANPNNPQENLFEIRRVGFFIEPAPLLRKKLIINTIYLTDIQLGTKRESHAEIPEKKTKKPNWIAKAEKDLTKQIATPPILHILKEANTDSLITLLDFQSLRYLATIRSRADSTYREWNNIIAEFEGGMKESRPMVSTSPDASEVPRLSQILKRDLAAKKKKAEEDFAKLAGALPEVKKWIDADAHALKNEAITFRIEPEMVSKMLFGEPLLHATIQIFQYIDVFRTHMPTVKPLVLNEKVRTPTRLAGQDISFPITNSRPNFLIEKIVLKSPPNQKDAAGEVRVRGEIKGLASHPKTFGKPLRFELSAKYPNPRRLGIMGVIDHTGNIPWEEFQLLGSGIEMLGFDLPERPFFPQRIITERGKLSVGCDFTGDEIECRLSLTAVPARFVFSETVADDTLVVNHIRAALESKERFYLQARLFGLRDKPELIIGSTVDKVLAERLQWLLSNSVKLDYEEIYMKFNSLLTRKKLEVMKLLQTRQAQVISRITMIEKRLHEKSGPVDMQKKNTKP